ncbi:hypothetical protein [Lactobacillus porci]|uniref:Uncharacterized protein n=1 Tax=Lactobacillus porci TaxID=2012477 RepID=A0A6A8MDI1_9LACO|nr:hypothetical protein [Lactobacillus porci]MDD6719890.1 hypothetical protein [Lactobacillus porci]MST86530.1 hypothetical protein [Lactobacillus porci]
MYNGSDKEPSENRNESKQQKRYKMTGKQIRLLKHLNQLGPMISNCGKLVSTAYLCMFIYGFFAPRKQFGVRFVVFLATLVAAFLARASVGGLHHFFKVGNDFGQNFRANFFDLRWLPLSNFILTTGLIIIEMVSNSVIFWDIFVYLLNVIFCFGSLWLMNNFADVTILEDK